MTRRLAAIKEHFEAALPRIERHAQIYFRDFNKDGNKYEECVQDTIALAWKMYLAVAKKGEKNPDNFISAIAGYAAKQVRAGRYVNGKEKTKDVLSPQARRKYGFAVQSLRVFDREEGELLDSLQDNTITPPPDQAAFRIDFPAWLKSLGDSKKRIAEDMATGEKTNHLARKHQISPGRISQLRQEFHDDYLEFHGEENGRGR